MDPFLTAVKTPTFKIFEFIKKVGEERAARMRPIVLTYRP
ncbi:hypothetical protein B4064_2442 [Caldibacillus thermoamylovorans]|nr:hypothetical protein B4065_3013 [Caldibacillus thermoamylovorans]KIO65873.1 hypothetical protein B4064_2442 [Caldibacillus thermoamylovorans]